MTQHHFFFSSPVGSSSYNDYTPTDSPSANTIGNVAIALMGILGVIIIVLDITTIGKDITILKQNLTDMVLNIKYGFPKEPDVIYVKSKKPKPKAKTSVPTTYGMGMFKVTVSRPVYYKSRQKLVSRQAKGNNTQAMEQVPLAQESPSPPVSILNSPRDLCLLDNLPPDTPVIPDLDLDTPENALTPQSIVSARDVRPAYYTQKEDTLDF